MSEIKILCLSNGHGEDAIAVQVAQALQQHSLQPSVAALPMVGLGQAYHHHHIPVVGPTQQMPSGGFIYMDWRQAGRDVRGGLLSLTLKQLRVVRDWGKQGGVILAVGDIVPLLFAWLSGAPYAFIGTAKSEYYLRDEAGPLPRTSWFEQFEGIFGSVYLPWERWLMGHDRCRAVFPRDRLTTEILQQFAIPAYDLGNPMMDGLEPQKKLPIAISPLDSNRPLVITLLPGSRPPEAYKNWQVMTQLVQTVTMRLWQRSLLFLGAIAPSLDLSLLQETLTAEGWRPSSDPLTFTQRKAKLILTQTAYADCLHAGDVAIAMAGTATEQFVGFGKPVITLAGEGPQFTPAFAEAQTRLLGPSVILLSDPSKIVSVLDKVLNDPDYLQLINDNGKKRMGTPGAAQRIADQFLQAIAPSSINPS